MRRPQLMGLRLNRGTPPYMQIGVHALDATQCCREFDLQLTLIVTTSCMLSGGRLPRLEAD